MRSVLIAGLDVGSANTRAVIGEYVLEAAIPKLLVRGVGEVATSGVGKGCVADIESASECIARALTQAEDKAGAAVDRVYLGVAGEHVKVQSSTGVVVVEGDEVSNGDVNRVNAVAQAVPADRDRVVLHAIPQEYRVDHRGGLLDPVGRRGTRLEAELCLVTVCEADVDDLVESVARAGYQVQDAVLTPLAAARSVVVQEEKELGVAVIDMGSELTGVVLFQEGKVRRLGVTPQGGLGVTRDLIGALKVPFNTAAEIKEDSGSAYARLVDPAEVFELPCTNGRLRTVTRKHLAEVVERSVSDVLQWVAGEIGGEPLDLMGAGVVITGGAGRTQDVDRLAEACLGAPCRIGAPQVDLHEASKLGRTPEFATAVGLALHGADCYAETGEGASSLGSGVVTRVVAWLKEFF